jgi:hypothetical protein
MNTLLEQLDQSAQPAAAPQAPQPAPASGHLLSRWLEEQALNANRHAAALRPFRQDEFGTGIAAPSEGHLQAVNQLISTLRGRLLPRTRRASEAAHAASENPTTANLHRLLRIKEKAHDAVRTTERIWDFYLELFGQRQSRYGEWLIGCDRIALDCYQYAYMGVGGPKSIPAPPPFSYMRTGFSPATFRRGIRIRKLGQLNPFPLIQLPYHRLINPWTLGAILHEVSHNLQSDLGLSHAVPKAIATRLLRAGLPRSVAVVWTRWNRETFADLSGLLLGGPAVVASLMDVVGRSPETVAAFLPRGPHPTPVLRVFLSIELLRRMGFAEQAERYRRAWLKLYPGPIRGNIPRAVYETFPQAHKLVVDAICYRKHAALGGKSLAEVYSFESKHQAMIEEASRRLAAGNDPGVIPARFLIGAARIALDRKLVRPGVIAENFYKELARR